jgi:hypothetical protein
MNLLLLILKGADLIASEIVPIEELAVKIKHFFTLHPSAKVNIQNLSSDALQADADTLQKIADWQKAHGFPVTVDPAKPPITQ